MDTFKIPVDVQIEDKIVGPLTLRHMIIIGIGGGIAYAFYVFLAKRYFWPIWLPPTLISTILTIAFAFVKIHDLTFYQFILATIEYNLTPRKRVWKKGDGDPLISVINPPNFPTNEHKKTNNSQNNKQDIKIEELTALIETSNKKLQ